MSDFIARFPVFSVLSAWTLGVCAGGVIVAHVFACGRRDPVLRLRRYIRNAEARQTWN